MASNRPGFTMSAAQKIVLFAHALADLGVDVIEAGFPNSSPADFGARAKPSPARCASVHPAVAGALPPRRHRRLRTALQGAAAPRIHVFISTSPLHRQHKLA
jgi:2-isopropylmalate synthase